ncbi:MAG: proteasome accessory factor PafA2 family protein [Terracidiphilus sp.]|jgi:proteasome accessory factor A
MSRHRTPDATARALPKLCGADIELGNFIAGVEYAGGTGYEASRALLAQIKGLPNRQSSYASNWWPAGSSAARAGTGSNAGSKASTSVWAYNPQDVSRRFLACNGGSAYIDLDHAELCLPEVLSAFDHVAAWHGMLRIARSALDNANEGRRQNERIQVLVNNSDGQNNSYGSHVNFMISRRAFDNIFWRKAHYLQFLASFQVSGIVLTGQGKVDSENRRPSTPYQLSQRADFFETLQGIQTTYNRPIVNSRDEALCGRSGISDPSAPARLHVIFFDSALAHGSCLFRIGPMQLILTLIELGLVDSRLILDDPLAALQSYSSDPTLRARAELISGESLTAVELQSAYLEDVKCYAAQGVFDGIVPRAAEIIALWEETVSKLAAGDLMAVAPRLDWVMKLLAIERTLEQRPELDWGSPEIKVIDQLYSSLDNDGLYWAYEQSGFAEQLVSPERIAHFATNPPSETRAWTRAMLLRRANSEGVEVTSVDWDTMTFKLRGRYAWPSYRTFDLENPLGLTQAEAQRFFDSSGNFTELLDGLESLSAPKALFPKNLTANSKGGKQYALPATIQH